MTDIYISIHDETMDIACGQMRWNLEIKNLPWQVLAMIRHYENIARYEKREGTGI